MQKHDSMAGLCHEKMLAELRARAAENIIYSRITARSLVAVRPQRSSDVCSDAASKEAALAAKNGTLMSEPHVFEVAASAYLHCIAESRDQSIVLMYVLFNARGDSGSGKTESVRMILRQFCDLSKTSKKKTKTHSNILKVEPILNVFGNATTPFNSDATCFVKYFEFQFHKSKLVGMKAIEYLLDKSRITIALDGGFSFHIFYYIINGLPIEERKKLHLLDVAHFEYLQAPKMKGVGLAQTKGVQEMEALGDQMKSLGIGKRQQAEMWRLLAAILHLGNITFKDVADKNESCTIKNQSQLHLVSKLMGVTPAALEHVLTHRRHFFGNDAVSTFLNAEDARNQRDELAHNLYSVIFSWIMEQINKKLCALDTEWSNVISVLEIPGFAGVAKNSNGLHRLLINYANERILGFAFNQIVHVIPDNLSKLSLFSDKIVEKIEDNSSLKLLLAPEARVFKLNVLEMLSAVNTGIIPIINRTSSSNSSDEKLTAKVYENHLAKGSVFISASSKKMSYTFGVLHFGGIVEYDTRGFCNSNKDILQSSFVTLIRGSPEEPGTNNQFLRSMFSDQLIATRISERDNRVVVSANSRGRYPSLRRRGTVILEGEDTAIDVSATNAHGFCLDISGIFDNLEKSSPWFVFHLNAPYGKDGSPDSEIINMQIENYQLSNMAKAAGPNYVACFKIEDFNKRYINLLPWNETPREACVSLLLGKKFGDNDALVGKEDIFVSELCWRTFESVMPKEILARNSTVSTHSQPKSPIEEGPGLAHVVFTDRNNDGSEYADTEDSASQFDSEFEFHQRSEQVPARSPIKDLELGLAPEPEHIPEIKPQMSRLRFQWLLFVWSTTFCCLPPMLSCCGMRKKERQMAWREKVAICVIVLVMNALILFFIVGIGFVICPQTPAKSPGELSGFSAFGPTSAVYMYGQFYYIPSIITTHNSQYMSQSQNTNQYWIAQVLGQDVSPMFPKDNSAWSTYCPIRQTGAPPFTLNPQISTQSGWYPHQNTVADLAALKKYMQPGGVIWDVQTLASRIADPTLNKRYLTIYDKVYDVTPFYDPNLLNLNNPNQLGAYFKQTADTYSSIAGYDSSWIFNSLKKQDLAQYNNVMQCLNGLFYVGGVDHRQDQKCIITNYILLSASCILVAVIGFKFLAALQFPGKKNPENQDKFVICQVPCYTEGEDSIRRTLESLANMIYDDRHKLLFVICDGMIIGAGNDRPTPRIVLDILGADQDYTPESFAFQSLGDGNNQLNMAKVYSGLYETNGHVVPYIVVVKVGKSSETSKPGNRGKRDSQMILMRFLSRVHFNLAMSPLHLEIYHQMKNVIGVEPSFYEFIFMVDADTQVHKDALSHLVSHMVRDTRVAGTCGETSIANERSSFTTMIQVYEYFISHHLSKAFESLFGSVTCLPGCFCMYRIRTATKGIPVLISPGVVADYSENVVETLHMKNLLHLGEDRYLTTLMMKHFPHMTTTFCVDAQCQTYAPDQWPILLSQRRRWINSTVHNLFELLRLSELCGFCCFSMRFVVFIDLLATFIQPSALIYIVYLIVAAIVNPTVSSFPVISLIMVAAVYGFQIVIFLLKTEWQHIGWMLLYMMGIPLFGLYIPLYSFWHMDDFSWGNTRVVVGADGVVKPEEEKKVEPYDPKSVPLMKWSDYESALQSLDKESPSLSNETETRSIKPNIVVIGNQNDYQGYSERRDSYLSTGMGQYNRQPHPITRFPTDEEIMTEIRHILSTADLMTVTKKSVREQLARLFGVDLIEKKEFIHRCIDVILKGAN